MMIKVSALERGLLLLACTECAWQSQWAAHPDLSITKIIDDAMHHAGTHGVDELRGDRVFSRPGGGQDTRCPVLSLPPGPIASNSSGSLTDRDDAGRSRPGCSARTDGGPCGACMVTAGSHGPIWTCTRDRP